MESIMQRHSVFHKIFSVICFVIICVLLGLVFFNDHIELSIQNKIFVYLTWGTTLNVFFLQFWKRKYFNVIDVLIFILFLYTIIIDYFNGHILTFHSLQLRFLLCLYFNLRVINQYYTFNQHTIILYLSFIGIILSFIGILQLFGFHNSNHIYFKLTSTFLNPGPFGSYLAVIGIVILIYIMSNSHKITTLKLYSTSNLMNNQNYTYLFIVVLLLLSILFLTKSRSAYLAVIIPASLYLLEKQGACNCFENLTQAKKKILFILLLPVSLAILYGLYLLKPASVNARIHIWKISLEMIQENFWLGKGGGSFPGTYLLAQEGYYRENMLHTQKTMLADLPEYAYNEYLQLFCEYGICGLLLFCIPLFLVVYRGIQDRNIYSYGILAILIIAFTSYPLHLLPFQIIFIILLAFQNTTKNIQCRSLSIVIIGIVTFFSLYYTKFYLNKIDASLVWNKEKLLASNSLIDYRSLQDFEKKMHVLFDNPRFLLDYASILQRNRNYEKSNEMLMRAMILGNNILAVTSIGDNYKNMHDYIKAEEAYIKAFMMVPNRFFPLYKLCQLYYDMEDIQKFKHLYIFIDNFRYKIDSKAIDYMKNDINSMFEILQDKYPKML